MIAAERKIDKHRRQFAEAANTMQKAVTEASLRAATHLAMVETSASSEQAVRADIKTQGTLRRILDASGQLVANVARAAIVEPFAPGAFDAATFAVSKLLATAWQARGGGQ
jgi:hypothetical protein